SAGACYVPLDPEYPPDRLQFILDDARVDAVLTTTEYEPLVAAFPGLRICIDVKRAEIARAQPAPNRSASLEDLAYLLYTSGSTGRPKGVSVQHRGLTNLLVAMRGELAVQPSDVLVAVTTVAFDIAALELFLPLIAGAKVAICSRVVASDGMALTRWLESTQATLLQATPASYYTLLEAGWKPPPDFRIVCGGEALPADLAARLAQLGRVYNVYGPTETTIWSTIQPVTAVEAGQTVPIGRPLANTQVYVVDESLAPVPLGAVGELLIAGDGVAVGYHGRSELTAERFVTPPFLGGRRAYRTGDRVRLRCDEQLEFLGRNDAQVKVSGHRIELGEIDSVLATLPGVREVATVVRPGPSATKQLVSYVTCSQPLSAGDLASYLSTKLPAYMVPRQYQVLEHMPRTPNGKIDRAALPEVQRTPDQPPAVPVSALTASEQLVRDVWAQVLESSYVGVEQNFFDVGGNSQLMAVVRARISAATGRTLPLVEMYRYPTVKALGRLLDGSGESQAELAERSAIERAEKQRMANMRARAVRET
ncbi:MAG TPA: amino acid adenylation domain-containing protein, partial [Polyangiaceae bacterium]|nr:amino acid adenylation domain-containing protein [Polyangiaceae bacterium]